MKYPIAMAGLIATVASLAPLAAHAQADITGMWQIRLSTEGGDASDAKTDAAAPKLKPAAQAWVDRRRAADKGGFVRNVSNMKCLPTGFPNMMQWRSPIMIMQGFGRIAIITEHDPGNDEPRSIYLNRSHAEPVDPSWNGDSVGHWEGETLVVDTVGLNGRGGSHFAPITEKTRVTERFTLTNGGKTLVDTLTFADPDVFVEPYTMAWTFDRLPDTAERMEAVCEPDLDALSATDLAKLKDVDDEAARMLDPEYRYNASGNAVDIKKH
ncbi:MAG TPA: hypothetical protein VF475_14085 [Sphingobium sp.]